MVKESSIFSNLFLF